MNRDWVTLAEAAKRLDCSTRTVQRYVASGAIRTNGARWPKHVRVYVPEGSRVDIVPRLRVPPRRKQYDLAAEAARLGLSVDGVRSRIYRHGSPDASRRPQVDPELLEGKTAAEWARELGVDRSTVYRRVKRGLRPDGSGRVS